MSFFNLKLKKKSDDLLILSIPLISRLIILIFAAAIGGSMILEGEISPVPFILCIILFFSGCYKESWSFDSNKQLVTYGFGLIFLYKKTEIRFDLIENFKIEGYVKGSMTKKPDNNENKRKKLLEIEFYKLTLINSEYGEITIDTVKGRKKNQLNLLAEDIAMFCKKKLQKI